MDKSIMDYFPKDREPRDVQRSILLEVEANYDTHEVIVINAAVSSGKSLVAYTIAKWLEARNTGSHIIAPTKLLVKQYQEEFQDLAVLKNQDEYKCARSVNLKCKQQLLKRNLGHYCRGCHFVDSRRDSRDVNKPSLSNTWIYQSNRLYKHTLIADEAHTLINHLRDVNTKIKWQHKEHYPDSISTYSDLVEWLHSKGYTELIKQFGLDGSPKYLIEAGREVYEGVRKKCLKFKPIDISTAKPWLWPQSKVKKIILMSATLSSKDVEYLGLSKRRVVTISGSSPILAERRPVHYEPVGSLSYANQEESIPLLAERIKQLRLKHMGEKGLIHCTYSVAEQLREYLKDEPNIIWHGKADKSIRYNQFREAAPETGTIFIASGLYEGIDLAGDAGRWQCITKIPWPSLADPVTAYLAEADPAYYNWETVKLVLQAVGRICRRTDDYGITYIVDSSFKRLYSEAEDFFPQYFKDSLTQPGEDR